MNRATTPMRLAGLGGSVWGAVLLARGDDVWRRLEGRDPDPIEELGIRFLGARHLVQGAGQVLLPRGTSALVVAVDVAHVTVMSALAAASPSRRRAAAVTGAVAGANAAVTALARRAGGARR